MFARSSVRLAGNLASVALGGATTVAVATTYTNHDGLTVVPTTRMEAPSSSRDVSVQAAASTLIAPPSAMPSAESAVRAFRLIRTAMLMVMDYTTADWQWSRKDPDDALRTEFEEKLAQCRRALQEAQSKYTANSLPHLDMTARVEAKKHEKEEMTRAAEALVEAEEELATIGSRMSIIHRKAAERLKDLCHENRGVYIKMGQVVGNLDHLVPREYIQAMSCLFDDNPQTEYKDVRAVIQEELGSTPEELFDSFESEPIASASLAQVHVAYANGKKLAVKVQHRGLKDTAAADAHVMLFVVRKVESMFKDFSYGWIADETSALLPKELDFENEGRNSERAARDLAKTGLACVVPKVLWQYSSPRVLTMEFEEGFKSNDVAAVEKAGLNKRDVARLISSVFASQVFFTAFVHCDPHEANVLLRAKDNGKPEMVLVDHGLYQEYDNEFRIGYAELWKRLMLADLKGIKEACHRLGVDNAHELFAGMLTARPFDEIVERSKTATFDNASAKRQNRADQAVIRGYAQRYIHNILAMMGTLPRPMLLLLKMNDCLRHIDHSLGSPTNTLIVTGRYASRAVYEDSMYHASSWMERIRALMSYVNVVFRIQIHESAFWMLQMTGALKL